MAPFLLRRLLLLLASFIGIAMASFLLSCLSGVPQEGELGRDQGIETYLAKPQVRKMRQLLRLDLPAVINLAVEDRDGYPRRLLRCLEARLSAGRESEKEARALWSLGPQAFRAIAEAIETNPVLRPFLLEHFESLGWETKGRAALLAELLMRARRGESEAPGAVDRWLQEARKKGPISARADRDLAEVGGFAVPDLLAAEEGASLALLLRLADVLNRHFAWDILPSSVAAWSSRSRAATSEFRRRLARAFEEERRARALRYEDSSRFARIACYSVLETRFAKWLGRVFRLDFGRSLFQDEPVAELIARRLGTSIVLQLPSLLLVLFFGTLIGVFEARRLGGRSERLVSGLSFLFYATPAFFLGSLLISGLSRWLPVHGLLSPATRDALRDGSLGLWSGRTLRDFGSHAILPIVLLSYGECVVVSRYVRSSVRAAMGAQHVVAARANGLPEAAIFRHHVLRRGLIPVATLAGMLLPVLVSGSVIVESLFGIQGLGELAWRSALARDLPVVMGLVTLVALATMLGYFLSDLLMAVLDPRVRLR